MQQACIILPAFDESMIITADLTGDGKSTTPCYGSDDKISALREI